MKWKTTVIHKAQREVDPQKTHNTKHMQKGVEPHKKLKAFEDRVYKVTGFGEKSCASSLLYTFSERIHTDAVSEYG